jgi:hypothetical protein
MEMVVKYASDLDGLNLCEQDLYIQTLFEKVDLTQRNILVLPLDSDLIG